MTPSRWWCAAVVVVTGACGSSRSEPGCPAAPFAGDASAAQLECGGATNPVAIGKTCDYGGGVTCHCARGFEPNSWRWTCAGRAGTDLCPLTQPREAWGCRADNFGYGGLDYTGSRCSYGPVTCACQNAGQNTSVWGCSGEASDGGATDGAAPSDTAIAADGPADGTGATCTVNTTARRTRCATRASSLTVARAPAPACGGWLAARAHPRSAPAAPA